MNKLKQELKQLKIQIRVGIEQKQISQDWGILLLGNLEEAINYTHSCKRMKLNNKELEAIKELIYLEINRKNGIENIDSDLKAFIIATEINEMNNYTHSCESDSELLPMCTEVYKNWQIRKSDYAVGYYEATNLNDCDSFMKHAKSIEELKTEIDEDE